MAIPQPQDRTSTADPIRVMVVDDAVVVRGLMTRWLEAETGVVVVATHRTGRAAVEDLARSKPDVVVLDIEMPDMDGITALPLLLKQQPELVVIMASTLTRRNAEISLKCLSLGAADYVPKPETNREVTTSIDFRTDLVNKVKTLGGRYRRRRGFRAEAEAPAPAGAPRPAFRAATAVPAPAGAPRSFRAEGRPEPVTAVAPPATSVAGQGGQIRLRSFSSAIPKMLVIGSSTGGPQALASLMATIAPIVSLVPVLITQHMPPTFTTILAEHLGRVAGKPAIEPPHATPAKPGTIYVAPGGKHMILARRESGPTILIDDGPPVNFCKPAVDPLFMTASQVMGPALVAVVLTGMGADGAKGGVVVADAGGSVIAQDEASSVVWGMPGATAAAGACAAVLPLNDIGPKLLRLFSGDRP